MGRREKLSPMVLFTMAAHWLVSCYRAARKMRGYAFLRGNSCRPQHLSSPDPSVTKCPWKGEAQTLVCDIQGTLLRSPSFPFFMLVAFEGGNPLRALLLLLSFPLIWLLGNRHELSLRIMVLITFCGLRTRDMDTVARAVLPKFYLENLNLHSYEVLAGSITKKVILTSLPRVMVEGFLREYLGVNDVVGAELQVVKGYYTGFVSRGASMAVKRKAIKELFGNSKPDVGLVSSSNPHDHLLISHCKVCSLITLVTRLAINSIYSR